VEYSTSVPLGDESEALGTGVAEAERIRRLKSKEWGEKSEQKSERKTAYFADGADVSLLTELGKCGIQGYKLVGPLDLF
jgi:hypothetical protein